MQDSPSDVGRSAFFQSSEEKFEVLSKITCILLGMEVELQLKKVTDVKLRCGLILPNGINHNSVEFHEEKNGITAVAFKRPWQDYGNIDSAFFSTTPEDSLQEDRWIELV